MSQPKFENLSGIINGINTVFSTSKPYIKESLTVFLNGFALQNIGNVNWIETSPVTGIITLANPPNIGDELKAFYLVRNNFAGDLNQEGNIIFLKGFLSPSYSLSGKIKIEG